MKRILVLIVLTLIHVFVQMEYPTQILYIETCPFLLRVAMVLVSLAWILIFISLICNETK